MAMLPTCPTCHNSDRAHGLRTDCNDPWHADAFLRGTKPRITEIGSPNVPEAALTIDKDTISAREVKARTATTERAMRDERQSTIRMRAETSRHFFETALDHFVAKWAPDHERGYGRDRDDFQRELTMLMRDAMEHKSHTFGLHIERAEVTLDQLSMHATAPLRAIYRKPSDDRTDAMEEIRRKMTEPAPKKGD